MARTDKNNSFKSFVEERIAGSVVGKGLSEKAKEKKVRVAYHKSLVALIEEINLFDVSYRCEKSDKRLERLAAKINKRPEFFEIREAFVAVATEYIIEGASDKEISSSIDFEALCKLSIDGYLNFDNCSSVTNEKIDRVFDGVDDTEFIGVKDNIAYGESEYPDTWIREIARIDV